LHPYVIFRPAYNQQSYFQARGNRSCHRCQHHDTVKWLERQTQKLLPVDYFMVTINLPYQLRSLVWHHQKQLYSMLFECAISTLKQFGVNDKKLGSEVAMTAVLHTHSHRLEHHPHVQLSSLGGVSINNVSNGVHSKANISLMNSILPRCFAPSF